MIKVFGHISDLCIKWSVLHIDHKLGNMEHLNASGHFYYKLTWMENKDDELKEI